MMFGEDLGEWIATVPALDEVAVHTRQLPMKATYPAIVHRVSAASRKIFQSGPAGPVKYEGQLACAGKTPTEADQTVTALIEALDGYLGAFGSSICQAARVVRGIDDRDPDLGIYWCLANLTVWLAEGGS